MEVRVLSIACAIAIALPAHADADGVGVIAVSADRTTVATAVAAVIREARGGRAIDDAVAAARIATAGGAVPLEVLTRFRRVREQIDEGWRAYHRVQLDFAASRLAAARTDAEAIVALPGGAVLYADASLRLGAVLGQLGRAPESHDAIALALTLDPERPITNAEFSPEVISTVDAVRALTQPAHQVRIASEPPDAVLSIDGKDVGRTPLSVELALGQHVVVLRSPSFRVHAQAVAIEPTTTELAFPLDHDDDLARLEHGAEAGMPDATAQELTDAVLQRADLDEVVLVADTDRRGGPTLLAQRCAGAPARCTAVVEIGFAERSGLVAAARSMWQSIHAADLRYPPTVFGDSRVTGRHIDRPCKLCRNPYLWTGIGAAAIAGTIIILELVTATRPPPILEVPPGQLTH